MPYFESSEHACRYRTFRPRLHSRVIAELAAARRLPRCHRALDVACGTGHSTFALGSLAREVYGCDASMAMLRAARAARADTTDVRFVRAAGEALPFLAGSAQLVTLCMAFHWVRQEAFLEEAARVLAKKGELWIYNFVFPGVLEDEPAFAAWHHERYHERFPVPPRRRTTLSRALHSGSKLPLAFADERRLEFEIPFTAGELRNYLTTQSNVSAILQAGRETLATVDAWLDEELAPFFARAETRLFSYRCHAEVAVPAR